ncbi:MAG: hypothetical protein LBM93_09330, partial [Oscillospiraceae bacterium]|nr:hypothetical protein [Oscillospiraceae bacterium]
IPFIILIGSSVFLLIKRRRTEYCFISSCTLTINETKIQKKYEPFCFETEWKEIAERHNFTFEDKTS